jgi:hypothetical protein
MTMSNLEEFPLPPGPPEIRREFRLHPWQWVGLPLLFLIPILAALGVFGESRETATTRTRDLSVEVNFPTRHRFGILTSIELEVTNTGQTPLAGVVIDLDPAYLSRFSEVAATPSFARPYAIELNELEPGRTGRVNVELKGEAYGLHRGELRIWAGSGDTASYLLRTVVLP